MQSLQIAYLFEFDINRPSLQHNIITCVCVHLAEHCDGVHIWKTACASQTIKAGEKKQALVVVYTCVKQYVQGQKS